MSLDSFPLHPHRLIALLVAVFASPYPHHRADAASDLGNNNFNFRGSNTLYGTELPKTVVITGTHYLSVGMYDGDLHPDIKAFLLASNSFVGIVGVASRYSGLVLLGDGPWVCRKNVPAKLAALSQTNVNIIRRNIGLLNESFHNFTHSVAQESSTVATIDFAARRPLPPINVTDCDQLFFTPYWRQEELHPSYRDGKVQLFEATHTFTAFSPILFVDYFGIASFNYIQKPLVKDNPRDTGVALRYCGSFSYGATIYTLEPRPQCITGPAATLRRIEKGVLTVYKPNIVPVTRTLTSCMVGVTTMWSTYRYNSVHPVGYRHEDNAPLQTFWHPMWTVEQCKQIRDTKKFGPFWKFQPYASMAMNRWYYLQPVTGTATQSTWMTHEDKTFQYDGYAYDVLDFRLDISTIKILMPSMEIISPWGQIPRSKLFADVHTDTQRMYIWDKFVPTDLCLYTPRIQTNVDAVIYDADSQLIRDVSPNVKHTIHFLSDDATGAWVVDDRMVIPLDKQKFNCISAGPGETLYLTATGEILKWSPGKSVTAAAINKQLAYRLGGDSQMFYTANFRELLPTADGDVVFSSPPMTVNETSSALTVNMSTTFDTAIDDDNSSLTSQAAIDAIMAEMTFDGTATEIDLTMTQVVRLFEEQLRWQRYRDIELQNANLHSRAQAYCRQSQVDWDIYSQLLDINPSKAIGARMREAVLAVPAGNGYYAVKPCEIITIEGVLPYMYTNSSVRFYIDINRNLSLTGREIAVRLGVIPSQGKCFSYPIIKFRLQNSPDILFGQLTLDGTINTITAKLIEPCALNRFQVFDIGNSSYFFADYTLIGSALSRDVKENLQAMAKNNALLVKNDTTYDPVATFMSNIRLITLATPLVEEGFKHSAGDVTNTERYSNYEKEQQGGSIMNYVQDTIFANLQLAIMQQKFLVDYGTNKYKDDGGFGVPGFDIFTQGVDTLLRIADKTANTVLDAGGHLSSGVGSLLKGVGNGVADIGEGLGEGIAGIGNGIGDALGGLLTGLILPLVVVAGGLVAGLIIYKVFIAKKDKPAKPPEQSDLKKLQDEDEDEVMAERRWRRRQRARRDEFDDDDY